METTNSPKKIISPVFKIIEATYRFIEFFDNKYNSDYILEQIK